MIKGGERVAQAFALAARLKAQGAKYVSIHITAHGYVVRPIKKL
jgi:hypothetical protein